MSPRTRPPRHTRPNAQASHVEPDPGDAILNQQMADVLKEGAEAREARDQASSMEDSRANERMRVELRNLVGGNGT